MLVIGIVSLLILAVWILDRALAALSGELPQTDPEWEAQHCVAAAELHAAFIDFRDTLLEPFVPVFTTIGDWLSGENDHGND